MTTTAGRAAEPHDDSTSSLPSGASSRAPTEVGSGVSTWEGNGSRSTIERLVKLVAGILGPTTVLSALLLYFGYVATLAQYAYFGVDVATAGLTSQDYLLRSASAVYVPLGAVCLVALLALWGHIAVLGIVDGGTRRRAVRAGLLAVAVGGVLALGRGLLGVVVPSIARREFSGLTPLSLAAGVVLLAYVRWLRSRLTPDKPTTPDSHRAVEFAASALVAGLVILSLFWAANSFAAAYGRGRGKAIAERLDRRPAVVLDTRERLYVLDPKVDESELPIEENQVYRYRYRGLRLLLQSSDRMLLVHEGWRRSDGIVVVVPNDDARLQLSAG